VAESAGLEAAGLGLTDLDRRHLSELHQLAAAAGVPRFRTLRREQLLEALGEAREQGEAYAIVKIEKLVSTREEAERETQRLNALSGGSSYFWQPSNQGHEETP
jgi:hypothetical protein